MAEVQCLRIIIGNLCSYGTRHMSKSNDIFGVMLYVILLILYVKYEYGTISSYYVILGTYCS
jgi:hypothetical protein